MKAEDLMIGDWVSYNGTAITVENKHVDIPHGQEDVMITSVDIEPIKLTAEILEKNGFERCATAPSFWLVGDLYYGTLLGISEDSYEDTWHVSTFKDHDDNDWVLFKVCYVHELQHILKLLDIDKEIEL